eukprot:m.337197 g.337197  ORF g.337197 m.337197 type:complete len:580 (-) comp18073_c0_seq1:175-1914(-)
MRTLLNYEDGVDTSEGTTVVQSIFIVISAIACLVTCIPGSLGLQRRHTQDVPESQPVKLLFFLGSWILVFGLDTVREIIHVVARESEGDEHSRAYKGLFGAFMCLTALRTGVIFAVTHREDTQSYAPKPVQIYGSSVAIIACFALMIVMAAMAQGDRSERLTVATIVIIFYIIASLDIALATCIASCLQTDEGCSGFMQRLMRGKATGYYLMFVGLLLHALAAILYIASDSVCDEPSAHCKDCIFTDSFTHQSWRYLIDVFGTIFILWGLFCPKYEQSPSVAPTPIEIPLKPTEPEKPKEEYKPEPQPEPKPEPKPTPQQPPEKPPQDYDPVVEPEKANYVSPNDGSSDPPPKDPTPAPLITPNDGPAHPELSPDTGGGLLDDRLLRKMYDMFSDADAQDPDAGLSEEEFTSKVEIEKLKKTLEPIGGLRLKRLIKDGEDIPETIDAALIFWLLDRDHSNHVTIREFLTLIEKKAKSGKPALLADATLKKLYDMFSKADAEADAGLTETEFEAKIDLDEIKKTLEPLEGLNIKWLTKTEQNTTMSRKELFQELDKNKDGHITIREFLEMITVSQGVLNA